MQIFISHLSEDKERIGSIIIEILKRRNWTLFLDRPQDLGLDPSLYDGRIKAILSGDLWEVGLQNALRQADCIAGFLSESVTKRRQSKGSCDQIVKELASGLTSSPPRTVIFELDRLTVEDRAWLGKASERHDVSLNDAQIVKLLRLPDPAGYVIGQIEERLSLGQGQHTNITDFPHESIAEAISRDPQITQLPSVFEANETLPVATAYVELAIAPRSGVAHPHLLEPLETPRERLERREQQLRSIRKPPQHLLDKDDLRATLIIGGPGTGKSSLLRRIALDIAAGKWSCAKSSLFIELRRYWSAVERDPNLSLLRYALIRTLPALAMDSDRCNTLEAQLLQGGGQGCILLADGLDEIAGIQDAVDRIYGELTALASIMPWITTCRPTGFIRSCGETQRLDMVSLDPEAVETLIRSWAQASDKGSDLGDRLIAEIDSLSCLRQMSSNPFLLTAICYLKSLNAAVPLPSSRIAIYEKLFEQIALQAQRRHGDSTILDTATMRALEAFCLDLYLIETGPRQLFSRSDWNRLADPHVDLTRQVLPARLVSSFSEEDPTFHFLHLSLQEHLLARALCNQPQEVAFKCRFAPAWRAAFRAYAALLYGNGHYEAFRTMTRRLYEERDLLGMTVIGLAHVFADAGIRDTQPWINADLREELWQIRDDAWHEVQTLAVEAHSLLDPADLEMHALILMDEIDEDLDRLEIEFPEDFTTPRYPGEPYAMLGRDEDSSARILARVGTPTAYTKIKEMFLGSDQRAALYVAWAFADIVRPSDRALLVKMADEVLPNSDIALRLFEFVEATSFPEFADFIGRMALSRREKRDQLWDSSINHLVAIGGMVGEQWMTKLLSLDIERWQSMGSEDPEAARLAGNELTMLLTQARHLSVSAFKRILSFAEEKLPAERFQDIIRQDRASLGLLPDHEILSDLAGNPELRETTILMLQEGYSRTRVPLSDAILARLKRLWPELNAQEKVTVAEIEAQRINGGAAPMFLHEIMKELDEHWTAFAAAPSEDGFTMLLWKLDSLLKPARAAKHRPILPLIEKMMISRDIVLLGQEAGDMGEDLLTTLMDAATDILAGDCNLRTNDPDAAPFIQIFTAAIFDQEIDIVHRAATALGRLSLPHLLDIRGASTIEAVLEGLSSEYDLLIFGEFWTSRDGAIHPHPDTRTIVMHLAQDDAGDTASGLLTHELARYSIVPHHLKFTQPAALVIYEADTENPDTERAKIVQLQLKNFDKDNIPIFRVPIDIDATFAREKATRIAETLGREPIC